VTGKKLTSSDLIKLHFHKNAEGDYFDPVSYKVFNEHTAIVAISTSGNVFTKDTVDSLNVKPGFWRDLVDDTEFTKKDIIILQVSGRRRRCVGFLRWNRVFTLLCCRIRIMYRIGICPSFTTSNTTLNQRPKDRKTASAISILAQWVAQVKSYKAWKRARRKQRCVQLQVRVYEYVQNTNNPI
jgi:hypothetical protein